MKFAYIQKCKCGAKAKAPTIWLLKKDKKENLISGRNCTVFKKHHYKFIKNKSK